MMNELLTVDRKKKMTYEQEDIGDLLSLIRNRTHWKSSKDVTGFVYKGKHNIDKWFETIKPGETIQFGNPTSVMFVLEKLDYDDRTIKVIHITGRYDNIAFNDMLFFTEYDRKAFEAKIEEDNKPTIDEIGRLAESKIDVITKEGNFEPVPYIPIENHDAQHMSFNQAVDMVLTHVGFTKDPHVRDKANEAVRDFVSKVWRIAKGVEGLSSYYVPDYNEDDSRDEYEKHRKMFSYYGWSIKGGALCWTSSGEYRVVWEASEFIDYILCGNEGVMAARATIWCRKGWTRQFNARCFKTENNTAARMDWSQYNQDLLHEVIGATDPGLRKTGWKSLR